MAEATPNTEMTLIADLNLDLLKDLNTSGAVRNLRDRRKDLYSVSWISKPERTEELLSQGEARAPKTTPRHAPITVAQQADFSVRLTLPKSLVKPLAPSGERLFSH